MPIVGGVAEGIRVTGHLGQVRGGEGVVTEDPMLHPLSKIPLLRVIFFFSWLGKTQYRLTFHRMRVNISNPRKTPQYALLCTKE